jgi:signal transduction histidine kinase
MAESAIDALRDAEPDRRVEVSIQQGITGEGDESFLRVVLDNLLGNAWKFTRMQDRARIEFSVAAANGETVYTVRDNGVGFDMRYASKLFEPFQRLHSPEEFQGTGIGLAIVRRIIKRHGGRIWAEAESGKGSTFSFTLAQEEA